MLTLNGRQNHTRKTKKLTCVQVNKLNDRLPLLTRDLKITKKIYIANTLFVILLLHKRETIRHA